jgi:hypothetical protein
MKEFKKNDKGYRDCNWFPEQMVSKVVDLLHCAPPAARQIPEEPKDET